MRLRQNCLLSVNEFIWLLAVALKAKRTEL